VGHDLGPTRPTSSVTGRDPERDPRDPTRLMIVRKPVYRF